MRRKLSQLLILARMETRYAALPTYEGIPHDLDGRLNLTICSCNEHLILGINSSDVALALVDEDWRHGRIKPDYIRWCLRRCG